jgi:hypothetical protein
VKQGQHTVVNPIGDVAIARRQMRYRSVPVARRITR